MGSALSLGLRCVYDALKSQWNRPQVLLKMLIFFPENEKKKKKKNTFFVQKIFGKAKIESLS